MSNLGRSTNQHNKLKQLLNDVFEEDYVVDLHIHIIHHLARGNVTTAYYSACQRCWNYSKMKSHVGMRSYALLNSIFP